jgi:hypothetical protein
MSEEKKIAAFEILVSLERLKGKLVEDLRARGVPLHSITRDEAQHVTIFHLGPNGERTVKVSDSVTADSIDLDVMATQLIKAAGVK